MLNKKMLLIIAGLAVFSMCLGLILGIATRLPEKKVVEDSSQETGITSEINNAGVNDSTVLSESVSEKSVASDRRDDTSNENPEGSGPAETIADPVSEKTESFTSDEVMEGDMSDEGTILPATDYTGVDFVKTDSSMYTYEQMTEDLEELSQAFPTLLTVDTCGTSLDGRAIPEAVLGNQAGSTHLFIQASIHAREYINTLVAMEQIEQMLVHHAEGLYEGVTYDELLSQVCFHILPMSNPDGVAISQMGIDGIRDENLREILRTCYQNDLENGRASDGMSSYWRTWKANARGVDLNRNFDAGWDTYEGVSYPSSDHYKGEFPASEPETAAILNAVHSCRAAITISYHSTGSVIYWDYGSTGEVYDKDAVLADLAQNITGYPASSSIQSSQDAAGCSDYFVLMEGIPSVTIENGYSSCPIDIGEFPGIWNSNRDLLPALAFTYR